MKNLFYRIIYFPPVNFLLRNINKAFRRMVPDIKLPPSGTMRLRLNDRIKFRFHTNQSDFVGFCLFWTGVAAYEYVPLFGKIIVKCRSFVDIGANGGLYSILAARLSEDIRVLAFDPTRAASFYLNKNIRLNHLASKVTAYPFALSDQTGKTDFFEVKNKKYPFLKYNLGGSSSMVNYPADYERLTVQAFSFDDFVNQYALEELPIDFVKVDAEGAEPLIISGMSSTIRKYHPIVVCEILPDESGKRLEEIFKEQGYSFYTHEKEQLVPAKTLVDPDNKEVRNCFFVHPSRLSLIGEFIGHS